MRGIDRKAIDGKFAPIESRIGLLVVGVGPAGIAGALAGAAAGLQVVLADENPVDPALIGMDVPLAYGGRATAAVQNRGRMLERVLLSDHGLAQAYDAGVEVALGTTVWGLFSHTPETRTLPGLVAGLADGERSWLARCDHVIVAAGARDLMLGFPGWDQPGIMGAQGLHALLHRYDACAARRVLILGCGPVGIAAARQAAGRGLEVAGVVDPRPAAELDQDAMPELARLGVPLFAGHVIGSAAGAADGVTAATLLPAGGDPAREAAARTVACDTIVLAVERIPNVELLAALGCALTFDAARGGWIPVLDGGRTTVPFVQAVGDCAGIGDEEDEEHAREQGRRAAQLAAGGGDGESATAGPRLGPTRWRHASVWMDALMQAGGAEVLCCRCESVTRGDVIGMRPPAYLNSRNENTERQSLAGLLRDGPANQDQVKRLTRAGMGECQGRRCREQTAMLIAAADGSDPGLLPPATWRAPVRPLPLGLLADETEAPAMRSGWDAWFGIPTQWTPWWDIGTERDGAVRDNTAGEGETWHL